MSDDSPQKGWDSWFGADQDSSGGERPEPKQDVPATTPPAAEPAGESPAETTNWTAPALGEDADGQRGPQAASSPDAAPTQVVTSPDAMATQVVRGPDATPTQVVSNPDAMATQLVSNPDAQPTQVVSSVADVLGTQPMPAPEALGTQPLPSREALGTQPLPTPEVLGTQPLPTPEVLGTQPLPSPDAFGTQPLQPPTPDAQPTEVVRPVQPQAQAQAQAQAQSPVQPQPPANTWQPPQAAQVWGPAPEPQQAQQAQQQSPVPIPNDYQQQAPTTVMSQPPGYPQVPRQQQPPANEDWTGWNEQERRRQTPPPAAVTAYQGDDRDEEPEAARPRSRRKLFLASGIGTAAVIGVATLLVLNNGTLSGALGASPKPTPSGFQPTGTSVTGDAEQTADAFLSAWASGNFKQAAAYTDSPAAASAALTAYESGLNLHGLQLKATGATQLAASAAATAGSAATATSSASGESTSAAAGPPSDTAGSVTFSVAAKVGLPSTTSSGATSTASASSSASASSDASSSTTSTTSASSADSSVTANWSYTSKLVAYKKNGGWWVQWDPSLVAPNMTADEKIVSVAVAPSASQVVDASGNDLSNATDPGVYNIATYLKKSAPSGQGTPGVNIMLVKASDGSAISGTTAVLSQPVNTGVVKTTFNPTVEAAAQQAVLKYADSSMVVLQPSTGNILAVANNDGGNDFALTARIAPGSTNKIITATALLANGLVSSPSQAVECPKTITVNGTAFNNSEGESLPAGTPFLTDFAVSCNNAFGQWYDKIGSTTLAQTAEKYYGLNQQWNFGTGPAGPYYSIPSSASNGELFQELFGQGQLEAAPLAMASVAATVDTGTFKQPIVVQGQSQLTATPLPSNVQQGLYQMMKAVTTDSDGTAYNLFSGVNSTVYGKTGTADVDASSQDKPNSWMVVFDPTLDLAIGCVVLDAGYGASFAGPETAAVLKSLQ